MKFIRIVLWSFIGGIVLIFVIYLFVAERQETLELSDETRNQAPGSFLFLSQGLTHYFQDGPDSSTMTLFFHGGGITGMEVWKENIPFFIDKGYQVLAYDLYGRGFSDRPEVVYSPEFFRDQLSGLLDSLNIRKPFNIVAMSMGAMIALDYADRHPENVKKIILIDPAITGDFKPNFLLNIPVINSVLMTMYWYPHAVENQRKEFVDQMLFDEYRERLKYFMNFRGYKHVNYSTWMHTLGKDKIHLLDSLKPHSLFLIYGERDPYFPPANVELFAKHYPSLQHKRIQNTGHMPHLENPDEVNTSIHSFLSADPQYVLNE